MSRCATEAATTIITGHTKYDTSDTSTSPERNAAAAIDAVTALREVLGLTTRLADYGITEADYPLIATDALDDEVLANTPRQPTAADITDILGRA